MKPTLNEKFLAWLALLSGISLSIVAEYYSILGLTSIFSAAVLPVIIMGIVLGIGKVSATLWLKQNWTLAPWSIRIYLSAAIVVLMLITSMGIFGFLSKAHSDQSLVSGDVQSKISVYDEKIKTEKENIDANRKALKQLDESVDQVMGRSQDEKGAEKAVAIRRAQQKERSRLAQDITEAQKRIASLNEERAPIAAEVRKVEAEVGPIKYIAQFVYGEANEGLLEKAVTWVIIILIVVFDPLAVILLLASQISFQNFREREDPNEQELQEFADSFNEVFNDPYVADVGEKPTAEELTEGDSPQGPVDVVGGQPTVTESSNVATVNESESAQYTLFVQNEEQKESNLWSNTVSTISQQEYAKSSQDRLEDHIDSIVELVKTGHLKIEEVPKSIQPEVRAKL
jgi:hypothetical protein